MGEAVQKKGVDARSCLQRIFMILASILGVPGNNGICEYIEEVWEESKFCKPLEITRKFANNELINVARRVKSTEMKPFQRILHFVVMKNVVPRFGKRDPTSFMDLTYMDHLLMRRLVNLPRVMLRHMSYVISVENHELPYGDWLTMVFEPFNVPLIDKQGAEPKGYDFFEETFLSMCDLKRENGVWWLKNGGIRRRDEDEVLAENVGNVEENEGEDVQQEFDWEAVIDEVEIEREEVEKEAEIQGESGSDDKFYDAEVEVEEPADGVPAVPAFPASPTDSSNVQQKEKNVARVDPLVPIGSIPDSDFQKLQADLDRARRARLQAELDQDRAENARLLALLQQATPKPKP
ncbi:hypothetical protein Dimus_005830 [Dionaea muscipula]